MKVEMRRTDSLKPYKRNPRRNDAAVDAVAKSIRQFGFRVPIVVDSDGVIISGHTRLKAAKKLGLEKVPVHVARDLTPAQVKALRLADNKTHEFSDWNLEFLPLELLDLKDEWTGFDAQEIADLLNPAKMERLEVERPINLVWGLFKIPADKYPEIAELVEQIAKVESVQMEVVATDEKTNRQHKPKQ